MSGVFVLCELFRGPFDGCLAVVSLLGHHIAGAHHILVVAAWLKADAVAGQLGGDDVVVVLLDALLLPLLLALLGRRGGVEGYLLGCEGNGIGIEIHLGVVGQAAQPGDVLALAVGLASDELPVVGVAGEEGLLIVGHNVVHGIGVRLGKFVLVDDAQAVAAHGDIAQEGVRVGCDFRLQEIQLLGNFIRAVRFITLPSSFFTYRMVEVDE